jgi:hypothetical protein
MFVTEPVHEFSFPASLGSSDSRRWRMVQVSLHAPWFVLTVEVTDGEVHLVRTACVAWDTDLIVALESLGDAKAAGLLCMVPGWCPPTGRWSARDVQEVWEARTCKDLRVVIFRDERGDEFGDRRGTQPGEVLFNRRLIWRIDPSLDGGDSGRPRDCLK